MICSREAIVCALAVSLLNSLWQGGVLGLVGVVLSRRLKNSKPDVRCGAYSLLLFTMFTAWAATFFVHLAGSATGQVPGHYGAAIGAASPMLLVRPAVSLIQPYYPLLTIIWALGVIVLTLRHVGGFLLVRRLYTQATEPCLPDWNACVRRLANRMGIKRTVALRCSSHIDVPCVFWVLRSCILLPMGAMARLTPDEVEALIAHELAHIAQHDVLFNFLQVCIETILFYHPTVWWLSMQIRAAREERCDDLALRFIADRKVYVRALLSLEEARATNPQLALGAKGEKSTMTETMFLRRIKRVLGVSCPDQLDPWAKAIAALGTTAIGLMALHPVLGAPDAKTLPHVTRPHHTGSDKINSDDTSTESTLPPGDQANTPLYFQITKSEMAKLANQRAMNVIVPGVLPFPVGHSTSPSISTAKSYETLVISEGKRKPLYGMLALPINKAQSGKYRITAVERTSSGNRRAYKSAPEVTADGQPKTLTIWTPVNGQAAPRVLVFSVGNDFKPDDDATHLSVSSDFKKGNHPTYTYSRATEIYVNVGKPSDKLQNSPTKESPK